MDKRPTFNQIVDGLKGFMERGILDHIDFGDEVPAIPGDWIDPTFTVDASEKTAAGEANKPGTSAAGRGALSASQRRGGGVSMGGTRPIVDMGKPRPARMASALQSEAGPGSPPLSPSGPIRISPTVAGSAVTAGTSPIKGTQSQVQPLHRANCPAPLPARANSAGEMKTNSLSPPSSPRGPHSGGSLQTATTTTPGTIPCPSYLYLTPLSPSQIKKNHRV